MFPNYNIYIQIKPFGVVFPSIPSLLHRGTGLHIRQCVKYKRIPEFYQDRWTIKIFYIIFIIYDNLCQFIQISQLFLVC